MSGLTSTNANTEDEDEDDEGFGLLEPATVVAVAEAAVRFNGGDSVAEDTLVGILTEVQKLAVGAYVLDLIGIGVLNLGLNGEGELVLVKNPDSEPFVGLGELDLNG